MQLPPRCFRVFPADYSGRSTLIFGDFILTQLDNLEWEAAEQGNSDWKSTLLTKHFDFVKPEGEYFKEIRKRCG